MKRVDSLVSALGALPGLRGVALQEHLQLGGVAGGRDDEVPHLMKTGISAVTVIDTKNTQCVT